MNDLNGVLLSWTGSGTVVLNRVEPQDHLSGAAPVDTSKNFTLAAWAKLDDGVRSRSVVATGDETVSSAGLHYDSDLDGGRSA